MTDSSGEVAERNAHASMDRWAMPRISSSPTAVLPTLLDPRLVRVELSRLRRPAGPRPARKAVVADSASAGIDARHGS